MIQGLTTVGRSPLGLGEGTSPGAAVSGAVLGRGALLQLVRSLTAAGATSVDVSSGNVFRVALAANAALAFVGWPAAGSMAAETVDLFLAQGTPGPYAVTWPANLAWLSGAAPTLSSLSHVRLTSIDGGATILGADVTTSGVSLASVQGSVASLQAAVAALQAAPAGGGQEVVVPSGTGVVVGTSPPAPGLGVDGEVYFQVNAAGQAVTFFGPRSGGAWPAGFVLNGTPGASGSSFILGSGAPPAATGNVGDTYADEVTGNVYAKGAGGWGAALFSIMGTAGAAGTRILYGTTAPAASAGNPGDSYFQVGAGQALVAFLNKDATNGWPSQGISLVGPQGVAGSAFRVGNGAPAAGLGAAGDSYLNASTGDVYGPKAASGASPWGSPIANIEPQTITAAAFNLGTGAVTLTLSGGGTVAGTIGYVGVGWGTVGLGFGST